VVEDADGLVGTVRVGGVLSVTMPLPTSGSLVAVAAALSMRMASTSLLVSMGWTAVTTASAASALVVAADAPLLGSVALAKLASALLAAL
jgi:hypothetical protein